MKPKKPIKMWAVVHDEKVYIEELYKRRNDAIELNLYDSNKIVPVWLSFTKPE